MEIGFLQIGHPVRKTLKQGIITMRTKGSFLLHVGQVLLIASLVGCKSPRLNPAGVYGSEVAGEYASIGSIPLNNRFVGGTEHGGLFAPVLFSYDSAQVAGSQRASVEAVGNHLKQNPSKAVIIEGHCDERGSREYNLALGEQRALAVRSYLVGIGIDSERIQTKSYGEENPIAPGHTEAAWSQNRRGEFVLYH